MAFNNEAIDAAIVSIFDGSKKPAKMAVTNHQLSFQQFGGRELGGLGHE
jgi:hypothetical protein